MRPWHPFRSSHHHAKPGKRGAAQARFGENTMMVVEAWASLAALEAHAAAPRMAAYAVQTKDLIAQAKVAVELPPFAEAMVRHLRSASENSFVGIRG